MGELDDPVVVAFPLRGEWTVVTTPAHRIPSHGTDVLGQRYAFDMVRADRRRGVHVHPAGVVRSYLLGGRTQDCYGYGQPVHAPFDGEVVAAIDGVPERAWLHVVRETVLSVRNGVSFSPTEEWVRRLAGNHVVMAGEAAFAMVAHLAPGSVEVAAGQEVREGDRLGRVGHTGNSTVPHLHFQLADSADLLHARGVPCAFAAYLVERAGRWEPVERGIPRRLERIRSF